jgi:hypothetical protein
VDRGHGEHDRLGTRDVLVGQLQYVDVVAGAGGDLVPGVADVAPGGQGGVARGDGGGRGVGLLDRAVAGEAGDSGHAGIGRRRVELGGQYRIDIDAISDALELVDVGLAVDLDHGVALVVVYFPWRLLGREGVQLLAARKVHAYDFGLIDCRCQRLWSAGVGGVATVAPQGGQEDDACYTEDSFSHGRAR